jgi:hypothetical protein
VNGHGFTSGQPVVYRRGVLQVSRRVTLRQLLRAGARTRERISA